MGRESNIEWTVATWNPIRGCRRISAGCEHCYAEVVAFKGRGPGRPYEGLTTEAGRWNGQIKWVDDHLLDPLRWSDRPRLIFVNSVSDVFYEGITDKQVAAMFGVMALAHHLHGHRFQVLTKRSHRMRDLFSLWRMDNVLVDDWVDALKELHVPARTDRQILSAARELVNASLRTGMRGVHLGVSVENQAAAPRVADLLAIGCHIPVRWVSAEPLLGPLDLRSYLWGIKWVVAGGESGQGARPCELDWLRDLRDQCQAAGVPFFLKQLGGHPDKRDHDQALLDGRRWTERPLEQEAPSALDPKA